MNIIDDYLPVNKYSRPGTKIKPTKIAVHYVGNAGSSAKGNRNYFASGKVYASSHYIIGLNGEILRLIPEDEISYCTNQANSYTISIECCHPDNSGKFNTATLNSLIELCTDICKRRNFSPLKDIIRHYDVTQKACPLWWAPNGPNKNANSDFNAFKSAVAEFMESGNKIVKADIEVITETNIKINGKVIKINRILKDDKNYIDLRGLEAAGFKVGFDTNTKLLILNNKVSELPINVDGKETSVEAINIEGNNYVPIRSIASATETFDVGYINGDVVINKK
ncbi:MAG: N-acetylmuramoyl-L-alanine amidase [Clostridia bacterium]|nr:N-acetylmuramoyl-L-alanine amidase [Clostridia bacterium]